MKLINQTLFIEFSEMVRAGVSVDYLKKAKYVGAGCWTFIKDPEDKRCTLIHYEMLKPKYKEMIIECFGDPYIYAHNQIIKTYLKPDNNAVKFYTSYKTSDGGSLPKVNIKEYIECATWINLLIELDNNWSKYKKILAMESKPDLYTAAIRILTHDNVNLPKAYARLRQKISAYQKDGYQALVSQKFGNMNSKKVKDELNTAMLLEMIAHHNQFDDTVVASKYNDWAKSKGFPVITATTVGNYRKRNAVLVDASRYGSKVWYDTAGKISHRERPSAPLMLINTDDNDLDLIYMDVFTDKNGKKQVNYQFRYVLYVLIDAYNDYILGYAIGETPNVALIKEVYRNAINHVKELTGSYYKWDALQFDRFAYSDKPKVYEGSLKEFYDMQGIAIPATLKVARAKVIEPAFGAVWHQKLKEVSLYTNNYYGNNITAKSKLNTDALELHKKDIPTKEQGPAQIHQFIAELRNLKDEKTGLTRQEQWLKAFNESDKSKKHLLSSEQHLMLYGKDHPYSNKATNAGLTVTIDGQKLIYEIPEDQYLNTLGMQMYVKYDPADLSTVLATSENGRVRLVCHEFNKMKMAPGDYQPGDRERLNHLLDQKKQHVMAIGEASEERKTILRRNNINAESVLRAGAGVPKQLKYEAERQLGTGFINDDEDTDWRSQL